MNALLTDLYELTMGAGYVLAGKQHDIATFDLTVRKLAPSRGYAVAAGLAQAVEHRRISVRSGRMKYSRHRPQFQHAPESYFELLRDFRFRGDLFAVPEGTLVFAGEPILTVRAPLLEAQLAETYLLSTIGYQTMVATKASRMVRAAQGRAVVEFGTRRAYSPEAGVIAARAAYVGGCAGTSNTLAGMRYGIPVYGTAAHSWVQSFESELESFRVLQQLLQEGTIYLIDTYDTVEAARMVASLGKPAFGVRLDSGDLVTLSQRVRQLLDAAGLPECKIMTTGNLNEYRIASMLADGAQVDSFGVGTDLVISPDAPGMSVVYKLAEIQSNGRKRFTAKLSEDKETLPGGKDDLPLRRSRCDRVLMGVPARRGGCADGAGDSGRGTGASAAGDRQGTRLCPAPDSATAGGLPSFARTGELSGGAERRTARLAAQGERIAPGWLNMQRTKQKKKKK
ncbi:MAG: nicotinate phosphoribosyltransferase, partial [Bryobacterales bacterium]|nr:nicotinate phosphoribosyltransferase [Bryobacterales bacterium]